MNETCAVVVTYNPDMQSLLSMLNGAISQVDQILVIDNSTSVDLKKNLSQLPVKLTTLGTNMGIAYAQNIGIELARKLDAKYILFLDQDSLLNKDMVFELHGALSQLSDAAAVGPVYLSEHQKENAIFSTTVGFKRVFQTCCIEHPIVQTDALISSGSLIPMSVLNQVGAMREGLFIDYVDTEWGLRAKALGFNSYAVFRAKMHHALGNTAIKFAGRNMIVHSPLRRYYQFRNAILLYKMSHIPMAWKLIDARRLFLRFFFYSITNAPRWSNFKMMSLGLWHGILGKTGSYDAHRGQNEV